MRKIAICAAAAAYLGTAGYAAAAGLSMKDEPVYVPQSTWTGFYIGAGVGAGAVVHELDVKAYEDTYEQTRKCSAFMGHTPICKTWGPWSEGHLVSPSDAALNFDGIGGEGIFGTVQLGFDWQYAPRAVFGVFGDFDWSGISTDLSASTSVDGANYLSVNGEIDMKWMWTVGVRFGYLATPDTLIYLLAGYTQAKFDNPSISFNYAGYKDTASTSLDTFKGYTLGAGIETRLDHNWAVKLEYRFTQLNDEELFSISGVTDPYKTWGCAVKCQRYDEYGVTADLEPSIHTGRVVLTYRFGHEHRPMESLK